MIDNSSKFFPKHTLIERSPVTTLQEIRKEAFLYPFYNDGVHMTQSNRDARKEMDLSMSSGLESSLKVKGFIFHTSHCGSTLLSRMMMRLPGVRVVSETEAINGLFLSYLYYQLPREQVLLHLRAIIECFRQPIEEEHSLIFKTTSWNVFFIDFFQELYPDVPWIYIDRETEETLDSSLNDGGGFVQWWDFPTDIPRKYFLDPKDKLVDKRSYVKSIIERQRVHAKQFINGSGKFFHYPEFIHEFGAEILPHFELNFSKDIITEAAKMVAYKAKSFEPQAFGKGLKY